MNSRVAAFLGVMAVGVAIWLGLNGVRRAGFADVALVPDAIRLRSLVPAFLAAAVVGRRPA